MLHAGVYPQFLDTVPHAGHGLPIIRLKPLLNQVQLMAGKASDSLWESSQILKGGAYPEELLHGRPGLYNFLYIAASLGGGSAYPVHHAAALLPPFQGWKGWGETVSWG
jgi:hypothetical protein